MIATEDTENSEGRKLLLLFLSLSSLWLILLTSIHVPTMNKQLSAPPLYLPALLMLLLVGVFSARAQCVDVNSVGANYRVRAVTVDALFGRTPAGLQEALNKHRGELYRPLEVSAYIREVANYLAERPGQLDSWLGTNKFKTVAVKYAYPCVREIEPAECRAAFAGESASPVSECVDVEVKYHQLHINVGAASPDLLLSLVKSNFTFFQEIPRPLLALNPTFNFSRDQEFGPALGGALSSDLLNLPRTLTGAKVRERRTQLLLDAQGRKSLDESFYETQTSLSLSRTEPLKRLENLRLDLGFDANHQPHGSGRVLKNSWQLGATLNFRFLNAPLQRLSVGGGYRRSSNRFFSGNNLPSELTAENGFAARAIADGRVRNGSLRGAVWADGGAPEKRAGSYRRLAGVIGYEGEFRIPRRKECDIMQNADGSTTCIFPEKNEPTIGVEALFGGGRAWGRVPEYARFFGGNAGRNFLYEAPDSPTLSALPDGPLLRGVGQKTGGVSGTGRNLRGGTTYWHFNLNVGIPVPAWSRPLIPAEALVPDAGSCAACSSIKGTLKRQVAGGKEIFIQAIAFQRLSEELKTDLTLERDDPEAPLTPEEEARLSRAEAALAASAMAVQPEADQLWEEITPLTNFIADHANFYSVKPLFMFDAARLWSPDGVHSPTRFGVGGGLQLDVVTARLQIGYVHNARRGPGDGRGNFTLRLFFRNSF